MAAFNLTAELNLRGPSNLNRVVSNIKRQLSTVSLNLNINPNATRGIQTATSSVQALNSALQNANASASTLNTTLRGLGSALGTAAGGTNSLNNGLNNIAQQVTRTQRATQQATLTMEDFGRQSALAVRRFAAFSVSAGAIYGLTRAITSAYGEFINFNKELTRLQQVTGTTANGLKGITDEITRLSTGLGVTSSDLLTVSSTLAQAGLSATETKTALEALAKSALAPSFDNLNDTVEGSIALMRQFGISANDLESSLGSVNAVAAAFAVESGDIIKAIQRTGGVFAAASKGVSQGKDALNEFISLFTSVRQTTRESAETIATGLRTIFTRIQRGGTIEALKEYGVTLTDLEGKFVGPYEAIRRLSEGLKSLDPRDLRFNQIVEELGGFRQIGKVIPLIQQFAVAQQALGVAQRGAGSLAEDAGIAQLSLANKITKVREEFIALIRDIGQSKSFQTFADVSLKLASALISVASSAREVLPALTALAAIKAIPAIGQFVGGFGRGFTRRNKGGPIRAFARGGYVPGSGNRDTIPAMLTPGEFVIRKKAVAAIGVDRLQNMNKYATGGPVKLKDLEDRSGASTIKKAYNEKVQPSDRISATINRKSQEVKANDPKWISVQNFAKSRYAQLKKQNPRASDKKLKDIAAGDAFEESVAKSTGGQKTPQSYPVDIIGKKNAIEAKFTTKKTPIIDLISKLFRYRYEQNTLGRYGFTPGIDSVNIGSLDVMEMGSGQKKQFMKNYPFNMGGIVQKFAKGKGVKKLSPGLEKQVAAAGGFENLLTKNMLDSSGVYNFGLVSLKSGTSKGSRIENRPIGKTGKRARIHVGTLSDRSKYDDIERNVVSSLQGVITQTGTALAGSLGSSIIGGKQGQQILNGAVLSSATGSIFEAALQMVGAPYIDKIESLKSMDFPFGLGKASSLFGSMPPNIPTDATRTIGGTGKGISDFVGQISRFLGAVDKKEFTKQLGTAAPDVFRALSQGGFSSKKAQRLNSLLQGSGIMVSVGSKPLKAAGKSQLEKGLPGVSPELRQRILDEIAAPYAKGGSIEDTVPALLTPGEFVINKKAAKRIGSAKLNKLNKADKIQGFNKGGAVGNIQSFAGGGDVQRFFVGGAVRAFTGLISAVQQLTQRMSLLGRNIPSGGGWTGGTSLSRLTGGGVRDSRGSTMSTALLFIGPMIAESINTALSKQFGQRGAALGSVASSTVSGATIGAAFGPKGMAVGAILGFVSGLLNAKSAINEYIKAQNEAKIETKSASVEKGLEKLASGAEFTAEQFTSLGSNLNQLVALVRDNINIISEEAGGGRLGKITRGAKNSLLAEVSDAILGTEFLGAPALDIDKLGREIFAVSQPSIGNVQRALVTGLEKGINLEELNKKTGGLASRRLESPAAQAKGLTELDRILAMMENGASIAREEAQLEEARIRAREGGDPLDIKAVQGLEQSLAERYKLGSDAQKELMKASEKTAIGIKAVVSQMELFAEASKNLSAIISRANAEFEESSRVRDIITGPGLGEARIAGPSRLNENVLSNMRAYSQQEVLSTIDTLSKNLGLDPEFTTQAKTSAVAQQTLERDLPKILLEAAQKQATGQFDEGTVRDEIRSVFKPIRELLQGEINDEQLSETIETISKRLEKEVGSLQGKNFQEIVGSIPEFNQILEPLSKPVGVLQEAAKSFNDVIANTNNALNQYSSHIARITELQNQAVTIQLESANSLRQALGEYVSVGDLNRPFETTIDRLTSTRGPNGLIVPGTGTLDPEEIARRLEQASKEFTALSLEQRPADPKKAQEFSDRLVKAKTAVDRLSLAQEKLATDTTRAANALNRVRDLVQVREARRTGAEEILKNINNPEFMMDFVRDFGSFERVRGGQGTMMDIPAAIEMFNRRLQMIDPAQREDETRRFYQRIEEVMTRDVRRGGGGADPATVKEFLDAFINRPEQDNQIKTAIDQYNAAIKTQSTATENMAKMMTDSSEMFYNKVIQAGIDFYNMVSGMRLGGFGVDVNPNPIIPNMASTGGLIYANKGRLVNFQPRGTDTVPAMLTPGEFVVNAKATKKNMGLLKAINGGGAKKLSKGGMVYLASGGPVDIEKGKKLFSQFLTSSGENKYYADLLASGSQVDLETLFKDLRATSERPLGYESLAPEDIPAVDAAIDEFIKNYEVGRVAQINAEIEKIKELRAADAPKLAELQAQEIGRAVNAGIVSMSDLGIKNGDYYTASRPLSVDERDRLRKFEIDKAAEEREARTQAANIRLSGQVAQFDNRSEKERLAQDPDMLRFWQNEYKMQGRGEFIPKGTPDEEARKEINPYTNKPYENRFEKEGVEARQAFEARRKALADAKAQEKAQKQQNAAATSEIFGLSLIQRYRNSKYYKGTSDPILREFIENRIAEKAVGLNTGNLNSKTLDARIGDIVVSSTAEYNRQGRARREMIARSQEDFAKKNMQIALQQFGEGVDRSPILAAAAAIPKGVANVIRTGVGGAGVLAGGITYAAGSLAGKDNFVTQLGKSLMESGGAQAGIGIEGILQTGAGLGSRLGLGEAYDIAEKEAMRRREELISGEANKARGAYSTNNKTTAGNLFTPENVVRAAITAGDVFGEAVGELGGERLFTRMFPTAFKGVAKTATKQTTPRFTRAMQDQIDAEASEAIVNNIIGGAKLVGKVAAQTPRAIGKGAQSLFGMAKGVVGQPIEAVGNMLRNRSTMKWFQGLQKQASSSGSDALSKLIKSAKINKGIGQGSSQWMSDFGQQTQEYISGLISKGKKAFTRPQTQKAIPSAPNTDTFEPYKLSLMDKLYLGITKSRSKQTGLLPSGRRGKILMDRARKSRNSAFGGDDPSTWSKYERRYTIDAFRKEMTGSRSRPFAREKAMAEARLAAEKRGGLRPMRDISAEREAIRKKFDSQPDDEYLGFDPVEAAEFASLKSNTVRQYLAAMPEGQVAAFKKLASQASPGKQPLLLIDMLEQAAESNLKYLDPSNTSPAQLQQILKDMASKSKKAQKLGGKIKATGAYTSSDNQIIAMNPVSGVHESAHFVQAMTNKLKISYKDLKGMVSGIDLDKFLQGSEYQNIVSKVNTIYTGNKISGSVPEELFTVLNQAMADPKSRELMENSPMAKEILRKLWEAHGYKKGGKVVYASKGKLVPYQPKGTDTVPAMLTPGEFVVNAKATKKNLGLLKAINGGAKGYSKGGVAYLQGGGDVKPQQTDGDGLLGMRYIGEAMDTLFAWDVADQNIEPFEFERAAMHIEQGLKYIKKQSELSPNNIDNQAVLDFESAINSLIQSDGNTISKMSPEEFNTWRSSYNDAYQKLKTSLENNQPPPIYILDDLVSMFDKPPTSPQGDQPQSPQYGPALPPVSPTKDELADIGSFVGGRLGQLRLPASGVEVPEDDPYADMNPRQRMLAMRKAEYEASQQAKREAFRTRTGRDPKTGRIGGPKVELTPEEKAQNKRRAEIRATREALGAKAAWVYDEEAKDWKYTLTDEESNRLASAEVEFERSLSPEQMKNRKRAERLASMSRGLGGYFSDTEEKRSLGLVNKPYGAPDRQAEFVAELSPDQIANRERVEKLALLNLQERSAEQQEKLDILRTPLDQRSPEQIARLEELRRERSEAIYASKGRLINFQPRGSDTVPAMLTPGEFVVNKRATKQNLGLLKQINSQRFNNGGIVMQNPQYLDVGGKAKGASGSMFGGVLPIDTSDLSSSFSDFGSYVGDLSSSIGQFSNIASSISGAFSGLDNVVSAFTALSAVSSLLSGTATGLGSAIGTFNTAVGQLSTVLGAIPTNISLNVSGSVPIDINVTVNGGEGLDEKLDTFKDQIYNEISAEITSQTNGRLRINLNTSKR